MCLVTHNRRTRVQGRTHTDAHTRTHAQTHYNRAHKHSPAAVGGDSNSDKQLWCYKGGRKSIKRDNKIAIEFL